MQERRPGVWRLRVFVGDDPVTGNKRHSSRTFAGTKRQAETALSRFVADVASGEHGSPSMTVAGLLDAFIDHSENVGRSPTTIAEYRRLTRNLSAGIGRKPLAKLAPHHLDELYAVLACRGVPGGRGPLSPASVRRHHALLNAALRQALRWGWISSSPTVRATPPSEPRARVCAPTPAELRCLMAAAGLPDHRVIIALAAMTGARRGELCALRWSDVDLDAGIVHIRRSLRQVGRQMFEGPTKTHQERSVALPAEAVDMLRGFRCDVGTSVANGAFVFSPAPDHGKPYPPHTISTMFGRIAEKCGSPYHFHQLRHFAATESIAAGFDPVTVAARLGHADPSVTLRVYAHAVEARDRAAAEMLGALVMPSRK